ncbi:MAG: hypothetical protein AB1640_05870 [bacterium]
MNVPESALKHAALGGGGARSRAHAAAASLCGLLAIAGAVTLYLGVQADPVRAWRIYLVNFLFFTGIGTGGLLFTCVLNMASGAWGRNVKRAAEGLGLFLPVSLLLFALMIPGLDDILPWVKHPYGPAWWLDLDFLVVRNLAGLALLAILGLYIIYLSLRSDFTYALESGQRPTGALARLLARNSKGAAHEGAAAGRRLVILSPVYTIAFALVLTVLGVDLIMSLKAKWYSTLIGAYYFVGSFYTSLAALLVAVIWTRRQFGLYAAIQPRHLHDIAKLCMAFGIVTGDFFYTQLFVIWYGNLPFETSFVIDRLHDTPWRYVGILVLLLCFLLPLVASLRAGLKKRSGPMLVFGGAVLAAMWMERFLLIGPSIGGSAAIGFGAFEVLLTLGFLGLLGLTFFSFMARVPAVVLHDPVLDPAGEIGEARDAA